MGKNLADLMEHQHDWRGQTYTRFGPWAKDGIGDEQRATWIDVHCTCGILMGQREHGLEKR